jgi:hypothetical protein
LRTWRITVEQLPLQTAQNRLIWTASFSLSLIAVDHIGGDARADRNQRSR